MSLHYTQIWVCRGYANCGRTTTLICHLLNVRFEYSVRIRNATEWHGSPDHSLVALLRLPRAGPRPETTKVPPHLQLDQVSPEEIFKSLIERLVEPEWIGSSQSRMASPDTLALYLDDRVANGPAEAFIDDHEFCHIHPLPSVCLHLTLPRALRQLVIAGKWGEPHLMASAGMISPALVLLYGPRTPSELELVIRVVEASADFAKGVRQ